MNQQLTSATAFHRSQHLEHNLTEGGLKGQWKRGNIARLRYGIYSDVDQWGSMAVNDQYRSLTIRLWERTRTDAAVVSHLSAASLWGLPLPSRLPDQIHLSGYKRHRGRTNEAVVRHSIAVPEADVVELGGVRCTSLLRTVIDIALIESLDLAVMCADAAMRMYVLQEVGQNPDRQVALEAAERFRSELDHQAAKRSRRKGVRQARFIVGFANWMSESPGESLSRLRMHQIGLPTPELQVEVPGPGRMPFRLDFLLRRKGVFGEFDGLAKYAVEPEQARRQVLAEKEREDWIRAATGWRAVRWTWKELVTVAAFEDFARRSKLIL